MKRIILSLVVVAFAVAVNAGDAKNAQAKDQPSCCSSKMKTSAQAPEGGCCASKVKTSVQAQDSEKSACCASKMKTSLAADEATCPFAKAASKKKEVKQTALLSPKAAEWVR